MTWKRDERPENVRKVGPFTVWSETNTDRETCHVIGFPDGREFRVKPDGRSGAARSKLVKDAVGHLARYSERLGAADALLILFRGLASSHDYSFDWEEVSPEPEACESCGRPL